MPGLELYWDGFKSLTTCRNAMYMSEGPIPWTAILAYCNEHDIVDEQREYFFDMISVLDVAYLELKTKKMQERQAAS